MAALLLAASPALAGAAGDALEAAERAEAARIAMIERVAPAVVCIFDEDERGGGSGVLIDEAGYGLTNFHVVADLLESRRGLGGLSDGALYELQVLGIDPGGDVAMFKLSGRERFPHAPLGDSDTVDVGDVVLAMGNPFMLADDYAPTVTRGIVSGVHRYQYGAGGGDTLLYSDCLQVDAAINPGNSGGPLFNTAGEVIGINGRISVSERARVNVGLGYAITANQIAAFLPTLRAGLLAEHGTIQALVRDLPPRGVVFAEVLENGPAWNVGIRPGDVLLRFEGRDVPSANAFASILGALPADWPVALTYRNAQRETRSAVVRSEAAPLPEGGRFEPDATINLRAVERVVGAFHAAIGLDPESDNDWHWRETWRSRTAGASRDDPPAYTLQDDGDGVVRWRSAAGGPTIEARADAVYLRDAAGERPPAADQALLYGALHRLHDALLRARNSSDLAAWTHAGADRLVTLDDDGRIRESVVLERIRAPLAGGASAEFQFEADSHRLRRLVALDEATRERVTAVFDPDWPRGGSIAVESPAGAFLIDRADVVLPRQFQPAPPDAGTPRTPGADRDADGALAPPIARMTARVVKLIGAKVGRSEGYGAGLIVSEDGLVLTVDSGLLDAANVRAVFANGATRTLELIYADRELHLALLKPRATESDDNQPPHDYFDLAEDVPQRVGQWVIAGGNPFKVAAGAEPISVALGVLSGTGRLDAIRGAQEFSYRGPVLMIDAVTSTPGFAGGALVDLDGRLLGMIGRVVEARATRTKLNYAIPRAVLARFVETALDPHARRAIGEHVASDHPPAYHGIKFFELGYRSNPVYVERVRRGSPAARAGVRKDDLVIGANGQPVPKLEALERIIAACQPGDTLELTILRDNEVRKVSLVLEEEP